MSVIIYHKSQGSKQIQPAKLTMHLETGEWFLDESCTLTSNEKKKPGRPKKDQ